MEETISLSELFEVIRKRMVLIIGIGLLGLALAAIMTFFFITPKYSASTQVLVNRATDPNATTQFADLQTDVQMINTYKDIIKNNVILDDVRKELKIATTTDQLMSKIEIVTQQNSQVFAIKVTDSDPYVAADIANTVAKVFQEKISGIYTSVQNVRQISQAVPNSSQISPRPAINMMIGLVLGLLLGIGSSFLLEFLDKTVRDEKFILESLGWTNLGAVSQMDTDELNALLPAGPTSRRVSRSRV
ncbi:YveK family protein [Carnobacterium gallinarum]|uniref:YveK family protein n=1 Tax=Carnobacterium gallinarum TaxID=2749 RepID=UPI000552867C|nr:Wzz/FepE/Etk N-terminal domain-containing protein [Carnobacterium gallinarum]